MKKLFLSILTVLTVVSLSACVDDELNPVEEVLETLTVAQTVSEDFTLTTVKDNVELSWESNDQAIAIDDDQAIVTQQSNDVDVTLTVTGTKGEDTGTKTFSVKVLKEVIEDSVTPEITYVTIEEVLAMPTDGAVNLLNLTVLNSYSSGTHFTDGKNVIYVYKAADLEVGATYNVSGTKTTYGGSGNEAPQIKDATVEECTGEVSTFAPEATTVADVIASTTFSYYSVEATIKVDGSTVYLVDGNDSLKVSTYNDSTSLNLLKQYNGVKTNVNVYLTGDYNTKTVLTYIQESDFDVSEADKVDAVLTTLFVTSSTMSDITLPTTGNFDSTITWSSNNEAALTSEGVVTRLDVDTDVTLTATVKVGDTTKTKDFVVTVISSLQTVSSNLFISEYYEGKSSNKYIEIYNPSDEIVDLTDYVIKIGTNGNDFSTSYNYQGTLAPGETFVIANSSSVADIKTLIENLGVRGDYSGVANFNGDDAIGLYKGTELIDIFGIKGEDPGTLWEVGEGTTVDHRIVRKPGYGANSSWDPTEWTPTEVTTSDLLLDDFGIHTFN